MTRATVLMICTAIGGFVLLFWPDMHAAFCAVPR